MSKKVVRNGDTQLTATDAELAAWGAQDVSSQDIMISKILPMQGMSKLVMDRKAQLGEYRDSVTGELLGNIDEPLEFVPFHVEKTWLVHKEINGKLVFQGMEDITKQNQDRKWEMLVDGVKHRFDWNYTYYVLLPKDIEAGMPTPYILSFRRTSVRAGKKLFTQMFVRNPQMKKSPAAFVINLNGKLTENDKGTFVTLDVDSGRESTIPEQQAALDMFKIVTAGGAKVDQGDLTGHTEQFVPNNVRF